MMTETEIKAEIATVREQKLKCEQDVIDSVKLEKLPEAMEKVRLAEGYERILESLKQELEMVSGETRDWVVPVFAEVIETRRATVSVSAKTPHQARQRTMMASASQHENLTLGGIKSTDSIVVIGVDWDREPVDPS